MLDFSQVELNDIIVHTVGNKSREEDVKLSDNVLSLDEAVMELLLKYFLVPFKSEALYNFSHPSELERNEVYHLCKKIFSEPESFTEASKELAKWLYEKSDHPKIKEGEFYVGYFQNCVINDEITDAVGIFKSENKDTYLKVYEKDENFQIAYDRGININRLDKGCLVFNTEKENGYVVSIVDVFSSGKGNEAVYWKNEFLQVKPRADEFHHTQQYLDVYKNFCEDAYKKDHEINKQEQVALLNKAAGFFNEKESFSTEDFESEVITKPDLIESFREYKTDYAQTNELELAEEFDISKPAVKQGKKYVRSVIKLDKNFHVYVHGDHTRVERGYDEDRGLNFYKLLFDKES